MQVLITESGGQVIESHGPAAHDELVLTMTPLWQRRRLRVRVATRRISQRDVDRLSQAVTDGGDIEGVMFACFGADADIVVPQNVSVVTADELIQRLQRCPVIQWDAGSPVPAYRRMTSLRALQQEAYLLDPVGIRWLPTLALNELPTDLLDASSGPQDLFERLTFRLLTSCFRFGGQRYGEANRGERVPDALLYWPAGNPNRYAALLDCKAASDGYLMESDHYLRFRDYAATLTDKVHAAGHTLRYMIVVSSSFIGSNGPRHPFYGRARSLRTDTGLGLVYIHAADLSQLAAAVEGRALTPADRERLPWDTALNSGLVQTDSLLRLIGRSQ